MATLELSTLEDKLDEEEIDALMSAYKETGAGPLDIDDIAEQSTLDGTLDDDSLDDFVDKLDANEIAADIYLPTDFEDVFEGGELRVASAHALILALENMREDFHVENDGSDDDDDSDESVDYDELDDDPDDGGALFGDETSAIELKDEQLRHIWKMMYRGAKAAVRHGLVLFVRR